MRLNRPNQIFGCASSEAISHTVTVILAGRPRGRAGGDSQGRSVLPPAPTSAGSPALCSPQSQSKATANWDEGQICIKPTRSGRQAHLGEPTCSCKQPSLAMLALVPLVFYHLITLSTSVLLSRMVTWCQPFERHPVNVDIFTCCFIWFLRRLQKVRVTQAQELSPLSLIIVHSFVMSPLL